MVAFAAHAQVFWDGNGPFNDGVVNGGTGTWLATDGAWTNATGTVNAAWTPNAIAVFQGAPGIVTVDNSAGAIGFSGLRFLVDGYSLTGAALTTNTAGTELRVGDGAATGSAITAQLGVVIQGAGGINKTDLGTLILSAANTYSGGTTISAGTLQLGNGGAGGSVTGNITNNASLVFNRSDTLTYAGIISGTGGVRQAGSGTTVLTAQSSYTGGTVVAAGTLQIGDSSNPDFGATPIGRIRGAVTVNPGATLVVTGRNAMGATEAADTRINAVTLNNATMTHTGPGDNGWGVAYDLTGSTMQTTGTGQFTLGGPPTGTGASITTRASGVSSVIAGRARLREGNPGNSLNITVEDGAAPIDLLISANVDEAGGVPSSHALTKLGPGNLTLTGAGTWTAGTLVSAGTFQLGNGGTTGSLLGNVVDNAAFVFNRSDALSFPGVINGTGTVAQSGSGTLTLTAANTYSGGTIFNAGVLSVSANTNLGAAAGPLTFNGGTLLTSVGLTLARNGTALSNGGIDNGGNTSTFSGVFAGAGAMGFAGAGTTILTGNSTYTGGTTIAAGTLQLGTGGTTGIVNGPIVDNGLLRVNRSDTVVFDVPISGTGSLVQAGAGTTVLSANNTYTGGTTIAAGTLQLGNSTSAGDIDGPVVNNGTLVFGRTDALSFDSLISGSGAVVKNDIGVITLLGANTYTGATTVNSGRLNISGNQSAATGTVTVNSGATLGGSGTAGGSIVVNDGGRIAPGESAGTLSTLGNLTLAPTSFLAYEFGQANVPGGALNDLTSVGGNLTLDGTLNVTVTPGGTFLGGVYRIIDYAGTLTDNGLALGTMPATGPYFVQTAVAQQVNLINAEGLGPLSFWDGNNAALFNNAQVNGGSGTWLASPANDAWTDSTGVANAPWQAGGFAIFQATPGTVTVDNSAGAVTFSGAQFAVDGYTVTGQPLTTSTADTQLRVGDGTAAGASMTAAIASVIQGSGGLRKTDLGTLVLSGLNSYTGGTVIDAGTLSISADAHLGAAAGGVTFNGGTLRTTANVASARAITLTGNGTVDNAGQSNTFSGAITGAGALTFAGVGNTVLTGDATHTGGTTIDTGTLQVGDGGTSGSLAGDVVDNGRLVLVRSDNLAMSGTISGTGAVIHAGTGTTTLSGPNSYLGVTDIQAGTLRIDGNQSAATGAVTVAPGASLGGSGVTGGDVAIADNARLLGVQGQTLAMDSLALSASSQVDVSLSDPGTTALFAVNGNGGGTGSLVLDGVLNVTASGAFGPGIYRLIDYSGALTDNVLAFGTVPAGYVAGTDLRVQTAIAQQVNLVNSLGAALTFWDGGNAALFDNNAIDGGSGNWLAAGGLSWTDSAGAFNAAWLPNGFAVFQGAPGTVVVDGSAGTVTFGGAQFAVDGYTVTGAPLETSLGNTVLRVGDGTASSATMTATLAAPIQGSGGLVKTDLGTLVLAGASTYGGGTTIAGGTLSVGSDGNLGDAAGVLTFNGGRLLTTAPLTTARAISLPGAGTIDNGANLDTFTGVVSGAGALTFTGAGTSIVTGDGTNTGPTTVASGSTLQLGNGGASGDVGGDIAVDGTLVFFRSDSAVNVDNAISGNGLIRLRGTGVSGQSSYRANPNNGGFTGAIIVESGARLLVLAANPIPLQSTTVLAGGSLSLDVSATFTGPLFLQGNGWQEAAGQLGALRLAGTAVYSGPVTLTGDTRVTAFLAGDRGIVSGAIGDGGNGFNLQKTGAGVLTFTGNNTYTGTTTVSGGTLRINGTHASANTLVQNNATLGGSGTLAGSIAVADGGRIAPGNSAGTLTAQGNLTLAPTSFLDYELGQANVPGGPLNDLLAIGGNLTLDGTLNVSVTPGGALLGGAYRIVDYAGTLTDNGLALGTMPSAGPFFVQTAVAQQVNLINAEGLGPLSFWDGNNSALFNNAQVNGGSGTWLASPANDAWTDSTGVANAPWQAGGFAIFQATPGTVTVDNGAGAVTFSGAQFAVDGYTVTGQPLTTSTADTQLRVGDGTAAGASMTAAIASAIQGSGGLHKTDLGTLVLSGLNSYTGGTLVSGGTLAIDADSGLGDPAGALTIDGATLSMRAPVTSARAVTLDALGATFDNGGHANLFTGVIGGPGALTVAPGTLTLAADNTYAGGTTVQAGATLQLGNGGTSGSIAGNVLANGTLAFDRSDVFTFGGTVSGTGVLAQRGVGTTVLTGENTYTGGTVIDAGTLQLGNGGGTGSVAGDIANNGALVVDRSNALTLGGAITGTGTVVQQGAGTTTLSGANSYSGATTVAAGTLLIDGDQSAATGAVNVASAATLGGIGVTGGAVSIADAGHLRGPQGQVFRMDSLALAPAAQVDVTLTAPGTLGLFVIDGNGGGSGDLVLDGQLNITAAGTFGPGVYRVMQYAGTLDDRGLDFGTVPAGVTPNVDLFVQTSVAQQVNLVSAQSEGPLAFWDGDDTARHDDNAVDGGNGTWQATGNFAWTSSTGAINTPWVNDRFAIFQATPGAVTVDLAQGAVSFAGAQFAVDGYSVAGQPLITNTAHTIVRVGDGTAPGAAFTATVGTVIQGSGGIDKTDLGTLVLTADNTWSGGTTITAGTLQLGDGGTSGSVPGDIANQGTLVFDRSDTVAYAGAVSGSGALVQAGAGTLVLSGASTYTGATNVDAGTLQLDGSLGATATRVATGATLAGSGSIAGAVTAADDARLAPGGAAIGTLSLGALMLAPASQLDYGYGAPTATNDRVRITGDLALDGVLNVTDVGGFGEGVYRVFDYGGALTDGGLALGAFPSGFDATDFIVQTAQPGQVNLVVSLGGLGLQFWDGAQTVGNGIVDGGSGTWSLATSNWTNPTGSVNAAWSGGFAVFAGAAGTVTLAESVPVGGMQFSTDGYRIVGATGAQLQADAAFDVRVDAGVTATVDAAIADGGAPSTLTTFDEGTLVLGGVNTYSGGTSVDGGTLQVSADTNLGAASGALALDTGTLHTTAGFSSARGVTLGSGGGTFDTDAGTTLTLGGAIGGAGALAKQGGGVLVLGGSNTYVGGTTVNAGTLSVSNDANLGAAPGALMLDGGTLRSTAAFATARAITLGSGGGTFDTQADLTSTGSIAGTGGLAKIGGATLVLAGASTYTGATQVNAGTLRAGGANTLPSASAIAIAPGATLDLAGLDQTVSSLANAGLVWTNGQGNTRLNVTGAYVGQGGVLQLATLLAGDDSPSDRLVINGGTATGTTGMAIIPLAGGEGALTQRNGILVVDDVTGQTTAPGAFALVAPVFAGPYEYGLFRGSVDASNAQAWYLRSSLDCTGPTPPNVCPAPPDPPTPTPTPTPTPPTPNYRPEVSLYAALPAQALRYGRALLGTLHERVGDQDLLRGRDDFDDGNVLNGAWMRVIGLHGNADGDRVGIYGEDGPQYDFDLLALQGGVDVYRAEDSEGRRNHAGVGLAHGRIKGDVTHAVDGRRAGRNEIEGTTLSAYWTHYGRGGGYLDAVLQGTWFDADAISTRGVKLRTDEGGFGWGASLEAGLPWRRGAWTIEPQAQVVYQSIDDLTGRDIGARVRFDEGDSLAARVGVRFARTLELAAAPDGTSRAVTGWLRLNYWHEFEAQPRTSFSSQSGDVPFTSDLTGGWGQVNLGVSAQLGRNASIYANLNYENGLGGRYDAWDGSVGFRWNW